MKNSKNVVDIAVCHTLLKCVRRTLLRMSAKTSTDSSILFLELLQLKFILFLFFILTDEVDVLTK